jgi:hypothetical protein
MARLTRTRHGDAPVYTEEDTDFICSCPYYSLKSESAWFIYIPAISA